MFTRVFHMSGKLRLVAVGLTTVIVVVTAGLVFLNARTVHGSGTGGGGCFPSTGPACHFTSDNASADFSSVSTDGCIFTDASVEPFASLTRPGGTATQTVIIFISKWDNCQPGGCGSANSGTGGGGGGGCGVQLEEATNFDPTTGMPVFNGTIHFDPKLNTAAVNGSAPMIDFVTGVQFTSTVNVSWEGYGPTSTFMDSFSIRQPGFMMKSHTTGSNRSAEASGVVTDETASNLATLPTTNANLSDSKGGTVQFSRS